MRVRFVLLVLILAVPALAAPLALGSSEDRGLVSAEEALSCAGRNRAGLEMTVQRDGTLVVHNPTDAPVSFRVHALTADSFHVLTPGTVRRAGGFFLNLDYAAEASVPHVAPGGTLVVERQAMPFGPPDPLPGVYAQRVDVNNGWACAVRGTVVSPTGAWSAWGDAVRAFAQGAAAS